MKVMLTPPDIWGSTGYVSQDPETDNTDNMYKVQILLYDADDEQTSLFRFVRSALWMTFSGAWQGEATRTRRL